MKFPTINLGDDPAILEEWIDAQVETVAPLEMAKHLGTLALPNFGGAISPPLAASEGWYWPWNRAGFHWLKHQRPAEAALIFKYAYLVALKYQDKTQERLHKGMPLANIAFSLIHTSEATKALTPAALGMIEDALTRRNPTETVNFQYLITAKWPRILIDQLASYALTFYEGQGRFPLYPETVLQSFTQDKAYLAYQSFIDGMRTLSSQLELEDIGTSLTALDYTWAMLEAQLRNVAATSGSIYGRSSSAAGGLGDSTASSDRPFTAASSPPAEYVPSGPAGSSGT
jgi:hypothetical protein